MIYIFDDGMLMIGSHYISLRIPRDNKVNGMRVHSHIVRQFIDVLFEMDRSDGRYYTYKKNTALYLGRDLSISIQDNGIDAEFNGDPKPTSGHTKPSTEKKFLDKLNQFYEKYL